MVIGAPSDENECRQMLYTAYRYPGPAAIRYPRGSGPGAIIANEMTALEIGRAVEVRRGERVAVLCFGPLLREVLLAAQELNATVFDMRWVKPLDEDAVLTMADQYELLVTVEENSVAGGAGASVNELLAARSRICPVLNLGLPDQFVEHGTHEKQLDWTGLDAQGILRRINQRIQLLQGPVLSQVNVRDPIEMPR
jgi:1-deoxy-D-xylulose-5-phosphate synthase